MNILRKKRKSHPQNPFDMISNEKKEEERRVIRQQLRISLSPLPSPSFLLELCFYGTSTSTTTTTHGSNQSLANQSVKKSEKSSFGWRDLMIPQESLQL